MYPIALDALLPLLQTGKVTQIVDGLPEDARLVHISLDMQGFMLYLTIASDTFPLVPASTILPRRVVTARKVVALDGFEPPLPGTEAAWQEGPLHATSQ